MRGSKKKIETILEEHSTDFSREIINSICEAVDNDISRVTCLILITDSEEFSFTASRSYYVDALQTNILTMIKTEEYEVCAKAKKYIDKLSIKLLENSK